MENFDEGKEQRFHRRNLPHWQPKNAIFFITARLAGSLPRNKVEELKALREVELGKLEQIKEAPSELQKRVIIIEEFYDGKFNDLLDFNHTGPHWFKEIRIANIWINALMHFDQERYEVICSTVMSNHVHFVFHKLDRSLSKIMKSLKGFSAREANKALERTGQSFWQSESYDRVIRDDLELKRTINYVLNNPVKAGLVNNWWEWPYNYVHEDYREYVYED